MDFNNKKYFNIIKWSEKRLEANKKKVSFSISQKLKKEQRITREFEIMFNGLALEELIALKLELAAQSFNGCLYGIPLWYSLPNIVKDACMKYAFSAAPYFKDVQKYFGMSAVKFYTLLEKYRPDSYFLNKMEFRDEVHKKNMTMITVIANVMKKKFKKK